MLLIYTSVFTFPFLVVLFSHYTCNHTFSITLSGSLALSPSLLFSLIVFLTFAVKLPIYGLHFWLPMAHVEAPTFGSMILAGVLLKLGGAGLLRLSFLYSPLLVKEVLLAYLILSLVLVTVVCCFQSDFKRLVAYSSVRHMITIPLIVLRFRVLSFKSTVLIMIFHGLSSPLMFILVGVLYSFYQTRQLLFMRGLLVISPLLSLIVVLGFFFTLSAPPFPSFIREVLFILSTLRLTYTLIPIFIIFAFLSLVYNLN